jgi:hypothetical protein
MKRKKHFMELKTFIKVCEKIKELDTRRNEPHEILSLHQFGESLLHPKLEQIFEIARLFDLKLSCATNTKVLQSRLGSPILELLKQYNVEVDISEHLFKSPQAVIEYAEHLKSLGINAGCGTAIGLAETMGGNTKQGFRHHEWLKGNISIPKEVAERECWYLKEQTVQVQANGTIVSCCADTEGESNLGNIMDPDLDLTKVKNKYWNGCKTCSLMPTYWLEDEEIEKMEGIKNEENI